MLQVRAARHRDAQVPVGVATRTSTRSRTSAATDRAALAQVHPQQRGDLVVAGPPGAQLAAQRRTDALDQAALQGRVHVLVRRCRRERPGRDVGRQPSSAASIAASSSSSRSPAWCRTRACAREPARSYGASRQSKCVTARQGGQRVGRRRPAEPAAPRDRALAWAIVTEPSSRCRAAASLEGRPHSSMKPLASDWSNVSPGVVGREVEVVQALSARRPVTTARPPCRVIRTSPD